MICDVPKLNRLCLRPNDDTQLTVDETNDNYQPSDIDMESSNDSGYEDDQDALDLDSRPTFTVTITASHFARTLEMPVGF